MKLGFDCYSGTAAIINLAEKVDGGQDLIELLGGKETLKALLEK